MHHIAITYPIESNTRRGVWLAPAYRSSPFTFYSILISAKRVLDSKRSVTLNDWRNHCIRIWRTRNYDCNFIDLVHFQISFFYYLKSSRVFESLTIEKLNIIF